MKHRVLIICYLLFMALASLPAQTSKTQAGEEIVIIERDALQTRNLTPVINHEAMIVNLTGSALTVDIRSPLPLGKYIKDSSFSAFGKDSLLDAPMFAPFEVPTKDYIILEKPEVTVSGKEISYSWNKVNIPIGNAALAQYDNYYGPVSDFYRPNGLEIAGLQVTGDYTVTKKGALYHFNLVFILENTGTQDIDEMFFRFFLPNALALDPKGDLHVLLEPDEIWASENLNVTTSSIIDGFGNTAQGIDSSIVIGSLKAGSEIRFTLQIDCKKKAGEGEIAPIFNVLGRRKLARLWPSTIIPVEEKIGVKKFYYLFYNLVVSDSRIFKLTKDSIVVTPRKL